MRATPTSSVAVALLLLSGAAGAQTVAMPRSSTLGAPTPDRFELLARSDTFLALFRRNLQPGPSGSLVATETMAPVYEYAQVRAQNLDSPWHADSVDVEVSGWGRTLMTDNRFERPLDGDVQTASITYHHDGASFKWGRQQFVGGAARFARFDGVSFGATWGVGFLAQAYGGLTVLPRWNQRLSYYHLGSESDSLLRRPESFQQPERSGSWMAGARFGYASARWTVAASFHEQREQSALGHRNLGLDLRGNPTGALSAAVSALWDADAARLADTRAWVDWTPASWISGSFEYLHTEPALWLSRQSVLSVFSNDRFDEVGGTAKMRLLPNVALEALVFATLYDQHQPGGRGEAIARLTPDAFTLVRLSYARVAAPGNGYHSLRSALSRRLPGHLVGTLEAYGYFYDHSVRGYDSSVVYAGSLAYDANPRWSLLWGASMIRSPYASLDAQTLLRASYALDFPARSRP